MSSLELLTPRQIQVQEVAPGRSKIFLSLLSAVTATLWVMLSAVFCCHRCQVVRLQKSK